MNEEWMAAVNRVMRAAANAGRMYDREFADVRVGDTVVSVVRGVDGVWEIVEVFDPA